MVSPPESDPRGGDASASELRRLAERVGEGSGVDWAHVARESPLAEAEIAALRWMDALREVPYTNAPAADALTTGFEILGDLGHGAQGCVVRARDRMLDREVALKRLGEDRFATPGARERFLTEARALASIEHPNVVRIHSVSESGGGVQLVLELVRGETLDAIVKRSGALSPEEAARIGLDLCRAAAAMHAHGLVHRDLKPANVMREEGGRIVVLDFGIAHAIGSTHTPLANPTAGTPLFMAPEQFDGRGEVGPATDVFAIGALLYWLVTRAQPFAGDSLASLAVAVLNGKLVPLVDRRADTPAEFARIVESCLARKPAHRPASAGALEGELRDWLAGRRTASSASALPARAPARPLRRFALFCAAATVLAVPGWLAFRALRPGEIELEATFRVRRDGVELPLAAGDMLRAGDLVALDLRAAESVYVYVFDADERGEFYCLFPLRGYEQQNPLAANAAVRLPGRRGGEERAWAFTSAGGEETLVLVASRERIDDLEDLSRALPEPIDVERQGSDAIAIHSDVRARVLRGIGGTAATLSGAHATPAASAADLKAALTALENTHTDGRATVVLRLRADG